MTRENSIPFYKRKWFTYTLIIFISLCVGGYLSNSSEIETKNEKIQQLEIQNNKYEEENTKIKQNITTLENKDKNNSKKISDLENTVKDKDKKISNLENTVKDKDKKISDLENAIKDKEKKIADLESNNRQNNQAANYNNVNNQAAGNDNGTVIRGNSRSKIYHMPGQRDYENMADSKDLVIFHSKEEAEAAGYRMAKR